MKKGFVTAFLLGLVWICLYLYLRESWQTILAGPGYFDGVSLAGACGLYLLYYLYQGEQWRLILRDFGEKISYSSALRFYLTANVLAYVPGKVLPFLGVVAMAHRQKISSLGMAATWFAFQVYTFVSLGIVLILGQFFLRSPVFPDYVWWLVGGCFFASLILVLPSVTRLIRRVMRRFVSQEVTLARIPLSRHCLHGGLFAGSWTLKLGIFSLLFRTLSPIELEFEDCLIIGLITLAGYLAGRLVIWVPAGLGVMEGGIIVWLSSFYAEASCVWYAGLFRLVTISVLSASWVFVAGSRLFPSEAPAESQL